jgi:hypothetical protein
VSHWHLAVDGGFGETEGGIVVQMAQRRLPAQKKAVCEMPHGGEVEGGTRGCLTFVAFI